MNRPLSLHKASGFKITGRTGQILRTTTVTKEILIFNTILFFFFFKLSFPDIMEMVKDRKWKQHGETYVRWNIFLLQPSWKALSCPDITGMTNRKIKQVLSQIRFTRTRGKLKLKGLQQQNKRKWGRETTQCSTCQEFTGKQRRTWSKCQRKQNYPTTVSK